MITTILNATSLDYTNTILTIVLILIIGRMIDRFVNGNNEKNNNS